MANVKRQILTILNGFVKTAHYLSIWCAVCLYCPATTLFHVSLISVNGSTVKRTNQ